MLRQITVAFALLALITVVGTFAVGCNTTKGVGQDLQSGGENLEDAARDNGARGG